MAPGFRVMARREEGEYSTYSTDEQRRQRAKDQARCEQNGAVEALARSLDRLGHAGDRSHGPRPREIVHRLKIEPVLRRLAEGAA